MHSDPIADLLTRIRNGAQAHLVTVDVPHSKIKVEIVKILEAEGYVTGHEISNETKFPTIKVHLRYDAKRKPLITHIARVSKPGLRVYKPIAELKPKRSGLTTQIISTSAGLMTDREARRRRIGGEVICEVY
jgi:small subunit ribosomal protein S8